MSASAPTPETFVSETAVTKVSVGPSQVWGGNCRTQHHIELPNLTGWIYCNPFPPAKCGGDVYYLSSCGAGKFLRAVLADVSGHGGEFSPAASRLRGSIERHIDTQDQTHLMCELSEDILSVQDKYATAVVLGFDRHTGDTVFTNAGHPPALWFHASTGEWHLLHHETPHSIAIADLPIGMIPGTGYSQTAVKLGMGDLLVLYTDGFAEATNDAGEELSYEGLLQLAAKISTESPEQSGKELLAAVRAYCENTAFDDDCSLLVLKRTE